MSQRQNEVSAYDAARAALCGDGSCTLILSPRVASLSPMRREWLFQEVRTFDASSEGTDPTGRHDQGVVSIEGERYLWRFDDYRDRPQLKLPEGFERLVLAIMRCDEDD